MTRDVRTWPWWLWPATVVAVVGLAVGGVFLLDRESSDGFDDESVTIAGQELPVADVFDTPGERRDGLRHREPEPGAAYVFVFDGETTARFTMRGVAWPLGIVWLRDGDVVGHTAMPPCPDGGADCPPYEAPAPYDTAVELHADTYAELRDDL